MKLHAFVKTARPSHWSKSSFVLAPLVFSRSLENLESVLSALAAAALFTLASSGVYFINDACDARHDSRHPLKSRRPVATGCISQPQAIICGVTLMALAAILALLVNPGLVAVLGIYVVLNVMYSFYLKQLALVDIMVISGGFVLRTIAGALAISATISVWLLVCTFFVALLMAAGKRRIEIATLSNHKAETRPSLDRTSIAFFDAIVSGAAGATMVFYTLYTVAPETSDKFGGRGLILTMPFVVYGVWSYVQMLHSKQAIENPAEALLQNKAIQAAVFAWGLLVLLIIYGFGADLSGFIQ